jgi:hypothetical protein
MHGPAMPFSPPTRKAIPIRHFTPRCNQPLSPESLGYRKKPDFKPTSKHGHARVFQRCGATNTHRMNFHSM